MALLTSRNELPTAPNDADLVHIVDTSDVTDNVGGTSKKITIANLFLTLTTAIGLNTAKVSYTDAAAVALNTAKRTYPLADETKLGLIEASATADQSDAEIKTAYENNADTNAYTDAEKTKLAGAEVKSDKDSANGYAGLDASSKINPLHLPALAISETFVVATEIAQLALTVQEGDVAVRTDENKSYIALNATNATMADWQELLTPADVVQSVYGRTGVVTAQSGDYNAGQVPEVADKRYMTDAQETKLDSVETSADVTDAENVGSVNAGATSKVTPLDADSFPIVDSAAANVIKRLTFTNLKAFLKTFFDTLYATAAQGILAGTASQPGHTHTAGDVTDFDTEVDNNPAVVLNTAKISYTDAAAVALNTAKVTYPSADSTKVGHISVTQAVDLDQMETDINALSDGMTYKGDWDASLGTFPGGGTAQTGAMYYVSVGGTVDSIVFAAGDNIVATVDNASTTIYAANWSKHDQTDAVSSVAGKVGAVTLVKADITDLNAYEVGGTDVAVTDGGTGASTAAGARTNLGVDAAGTDNSTPVTVTDTAEIDLTLTGQDIQASIVAGSIDETKLDVSTNASLDLADSAVQPASTDTLTNKTIVDAKIQTTGNAQTGATYTLVLTDASKYVSMSNGSANTLTVPPNSSVAFAVGTRLMVQQKGAGATTIAAGAGVTINAPSTVTLAIGEQYESRGLLKTATDVWELI